MTSSEMIQAYRMLEGANVAGLEGDLKKGTIEITFIGGFKHTVASLHESNEIKTILWPSSKYKEVNGGLILAVIGCYD